MYLRLESEVPMKSVKILKVCYKKFQTKKPLHILFSTEYLIHLRFLRHWVLRIYSAKNYDFVIIIKICWGKMKVTFQDEFLLLPCSKCIVAFFRTQ